MNIIFCLKEFLCVVNLILIASFFTSIKKETNIGKLFVLSSLVIILLGFLYYSVSSFIILLFSFLVQYLFFIYFVPLSFLRTTVLFFVSASIDAFLDGTIYFVLQTVSNNNVFIFSSLIIKVIGFTILSILSVIYLEKSRKKTERSDLRLYVYLSTGFTSGLIILVVALFYGYLLPIIINIAIMGCSFFIVLSNLMMANRYLKNETKRHLMNETILIKDKMISMQAQYFSDMVESYSYLRAFKHDINAYTTSIQYLINDEKYEELSKLTKKLGSSVKSTKMITCNNVYVGAVANHFYHVCLRNKITFHFEYHLLHELKMEANDICSLLFNLIGNAQEAALLSNNKIVSVDIKNKNNSLIITIINGVNDDFKTEYIDAKISSKEDNRDHGIGLYNINKVVRDYSGTYTYHHQGDKLYSTIVLVGAVRAY